MKMFCNLNENDLVTGIEEVVQQGINHTKNSEDPLPVHIITDEGESVMRNEGIKSSEPMYLKKATDTDTSS